MKVTLGITKEGNAFITLEGDKSILRNIKSLLSDISFYKGYQGVDEEETLNFSFSTREEVEEVLQALDTAIKMVCPREFSKRG